MELMTPNDTFLVRPGNNSKLAFPKLTDSLTRVNIYYSNYFEFSAWGNLLREQYTSFYFPNNDNIVFVLDKHPFDESSIKRLPNLKKGNIYFALNFKDHYVFGAVKDNKQVGTVHAGRKTIVKK
jgi:hypothetical protein